MNARDPWKLAHDEYRATREALAVLEHALPAFRELVGAFRGPMDRFLALDTATSPAGLTELAQTLSRHLARLSEDKQIISSNVALAIGSIKRYRAHLQAAAGGLDAITALQGLVDHAVRGIADIECMIAEAERLLAGEAHRILELALQHDLPDGVLQLAGEVIDRAKHASPGDAAST